MAGVALRDILTCLIKCQKSFCGTGAILSQDLEKMSCIFRSRRSTLETSIIILRVILGERWVLRVLIMNVARSECHPKCQENVEETCAACNDEEQKIHFSNLEGPGTKTSIWVQRSDLTPLEKYAPCREKDASALIESGTQFGP